MDRLPEYRGALGPAPWGALKDTPEHKDALGRAAYPWCPACEGRGFRLHLGLLHPCHCTSRPPDGAAVR